MTRSTRGARLTGQVVLPDRAGDTRSSAKPQPTPQHCFLSQRFAAQSAQITAVYKSQIAMLPNNQATANGGIRWAKTRRRSSPRRVTVAPAPSAYVPNCG